ncbi:MAG: CHASE2 domain-containing protein [Deltaproteobacteria bacterium]|jgi:putative nucleotidyltransferase with HDIG domain|nr:CHASE2 domain-containing protein [Deltaproteobacteria bacterium]
MNFLRTAIGKLTLVALCALMGGVLGFLCPSGLGFLENSVFDIFENHVAEPHQGEKFVLILAGDRSLDAVQNWPFPRKMHAELLGRLGKPKIVIMDILFLEPSTPEDDKALADSIAAMGNVVLPSAIIHDSTEGGNLIRNPIPELFDAANSVGMANVRADNDSVSRDYQLVFSLDGELYPSLVLSSLKTLGFTDGTISERPPGWALATPNGYFDLHGDFSFKLHHPKKEIPIYEYTDVLRGLVDEATFDGAIVLVGVNAAGATDSFSIGLGRSVPGSLFLAHAIGTVFMGFSPMPIPKALGIVLYALLAALGSLLAFWNAQEERGLKIHKWMIVPLNFNLAPFLSGLCLLLWGLFCWYLFSRMALWMPPLLPAVVFVACFVMVTLLRVRVLSSDWEIQRLSIDSLLFLGRLDLASISRSFEEHLVKQWPRIEELTGVTLLNPHASASDHEVVSAVGRIPPPKRLIDPQLEASIVHSTGHGLNRLILGLPDIEGRVDQYAILGWVGKKSPEILKSLAALVLSTAMHFKAIEEYRNRQELFVSMLRLIMGAVDAKDTTTAGHSNRVAEISKEIAQKMGLSPAETEDIYLGGLLHDVGKLGIPDTILNKPGRLDEAETEIMRRHPAIGADIMKPIKLPDAVFRAISEHHERLDGLGYPKQLTAESISLHGKILKIADVFDALASRRQYKDPFPLSLVYNILKEGRGTEFDAAIVNLILVSPLEGPGVQLDQPVVEDSPPVKDAVWVPGNVPYGENPPKKAADGEPSVSESLRKALDKTHGQVKAKDKAKEKAKEKAPDKPKDKAPDKAPDKALDKEQAADAQTPEKKDSPEKESAPLATSN